MSGGVYAFLYANIVCVECGNIMVNISRPVAHEARFVVACGDPTCSAYDKKYTFRPQLIELTEEP